MNFNYNKPYTEKELYEEYLSFLNRWKKTLQHENKLDENFGQSKRKERFKRFLANVKDRRHNFKAGSVMDIKTGVYYTI